MIGFLSRTTVRLIGIVYLAGAVLGAVDVDVKSSLPPQARYSGDNASPDDIRREAVESAAFGVAGLILVVRAGWLIGLIFKPRNSN
jgi:hypothetical protein